MPHLHTMPGGHDVTVSAWIVRGDRLLLLRHKVLGRYLQPGGHIEHTENPWQALAHEVREESGYDLDQLAVLQPFPATAASAANDAHSAATVDHPTPFHVNTHPMGPDHFHSDLGFALTTDEEPRHSPGPGESTDLRWLTLEELSRDPEVLADVVPHAAALFTAVLPAWHPVPASAFAV